MIKVGLSPAGRLNVTLIRLLLSHPDVDLRWVDAPANTDRGALCGEFEDFGHADFSKIDLYIGPMTPHVEAALEAYPELKAIIAETKPREGHELGLSEYNRKALVRGARVAFLPTAITYLSALALMPLAKNLLLNHPIFAVCHVPLRSGAYARVSAQDVPDADFDVLRTSVLTPLQASFGAPISMKITFHGATEPSWAIFTTDCPVDFDHLKEIYKEFYSDHRHVTVTDRPISFGAVEHTNKAVVSLSYQDGRISVAVAFDSYFKLLAGNYIHLLNLLFGLDERTGL